jgi:aminopeptidase
MMTDPRIEKYADVLINYCIKLKIDQIVGLRGSPLAQPLILELYRKALQKGAHPYSRIILQGLEETYFKYSSKKQLSYITPIQKYEMNNTDALIAVISSFNTKEMTNIDPEKQAIAQKAGRPLMEKTMKRASVGKFAWVGCLYPTNASAQDAGMSLSDYEDFVFRACLLDRKDPVSHWKKISKYNARLIKYLSRKKEIRIVAPDTDLRYNVKGRKWINCDGKNNFPDGEVFTAPIEDSATGHIRFTFPAVYRGREVEDVRIEYKNGKAVKATASKGEKYLNAMLDMDKGARFLGEVAIGTNFGIKEFTKNTLFDEKIGGTIHMALGMSYPESGGKNKSGLHWDMVCDLRKKGEMYADGQLFFKNGKFLK